MRRRWSAICELRQRVVALALFTGLGLLAGAVPGAAAVQGVPQTRIEARSADLLAVGIVQGDRMVIHLSRPADNAPVRDAVLTVLLRGVLHPTIAEADGSYTFKTQELALPGAASVVFHVVQAASHEVLTGTIQAAPTAPAPKDRNSARQLGWWVLNFAVCIGFLLLISRRRKAVAKD